MSDFIYVEKQDIQYIYISSSDEYKEQNLYRLNRTKNKPVGSKSPSGQNMVILKVFETPNGKVAMDNILASLQTYKASRMVGYYNIPYDEMISKCQLMIDLCSSSFTGKY